MAKYQMYVCDNCQKEMPKVPFIEIELWRRDLEPTDIKLPCDKKMYHFCSYAHAAAFIAIMDTSP